jgi:hypothetical protein
VEAIEDGQRHRHVRDDYPSPLAEKLQMSWPEGSVSLDQGVNEPNRDVRHEQECHNLPTGPEGGEKVYFASLRTVKL